jgi:hypothetical protein
MRRANFFKLLLWRLRSGHRRLQAARMRRVPLPASQYPQNHLRALQHLVGLNGSAIVIIELIRRIPDLENRMQLLKQIARVATSPNVRRLK